jgi:hypothetical protein
MTEISHIKVAITTRNPFKVHEYQFTTPKEAVEIIEAHALLLKHQ